MTVQIFDVQLWSTAKVARRLDCSVRTIYRLIERGELTPIRVGRDLRFDIAEISAFIERNREQL